MNAIDADTHVDENHATWEYLAESEQAYRPVQVLDPEKPMGYWLIDGVQRFRPIRSDEVTQTTIETRELRDIGARLRDMDRMGVEIQVIYPTFFLNQVTARPDVALALARSYNRWMADRCAESNGRLRWIAVPPVFAVDDAAAELKWAKDHGACGVLKKGNEEAGYWPAEPYYHPLYAAAQELDMPICFHAGTGSVAPLHQFAAAAAYYRSPLPVVHAFQSLLALGVPAKFPELRWGFIEANSSWIPSVLYGLRRAQRMMRERPGMGGIIIDKLDTDLWENPLAANRMYVTCEVEEDLPYLLQYAGEDNLVIGSDYTHSDFAVDLDLVSGLDGRARAGDISESVASKITQANPRALYGLSP